MHSSALSLQGGVCVSDIVDVGCLLVKSTPSTTSRKVSPISGFCRCSVNVFVSSMLRVIPSEARTAACSGITDVSSLLCSWLFAAVRLLGLPALRANVLNQLH